MLEMNRKTYFAIRFLKCWIMHFKKDFNTNRYIIFEINYGNFIRTVKYHWVINNKMSPVSNNKGLVA